jgi:glycerophosphoryl diester phosphodiesterase
MRAPTPIALVLPALVACAADGPVPRIEAHRAGAGYWPENSRTAVEGAIELGVAGIEVDLGLTADKVPVLWHDAALGEERCTLADGSPLEREVLLKTHTLTELRDGFLCGGLPDPEFPNALVVPDTLMTLDQLLRDLVDADPAMVVHLDIKFEPDGTTWRADRFAVEILDRWFAADPPQPFYVSSAYPELLVAVEEHARTWARDVPLMLVHPHFPEGVSTTRVGLQAEADQLVGASDYVTVARDAGADGLTLQWQIADRHLVNAAAAEGVELQLWTINDPDSLRRMARWPVDVLITDFPGEAP